MALDIGGAIAKYTPDFGGGGLFNALSLVILAVVIFAVAAGCVFYFIYYMSFRYKIVIFQQVGNNIELIKRDKARRIKFSQAGDEVMYTRSSKKYLTNATIQTGRNTFWFFIREDGEWINIGLENLNEKSRMLGITFTNPDMRFGRIALERNLKERFEKKDWLSQYGAPLVWTAYIVITGIAMWFLLDKAVDAISIIRNMMEVGERLVGRMDDLLIAYDNLGSSTSGLVKVA